MTEKGAYHWVAEAWQYTLSPAEPRLPIPGEAWEIPTMSYRVDQPSTAKPSAGRQVTVGAFYLYQFLATEVGAQQLVYRFEAQGLAMSSTLSLEDLRAGRGPQVLRAWLQDKQVSLEAPTLIPITGPRVPSVGEILWGGRVLAAHTSRGFWVEVSRRTPSYNAVGPSVLPALQRVEGTVLDHYQHYWDLAQAYMLDHYTALPYIWRSLLDCRKALLDLAPFLEWARGIEGIP